MGLFFLGSAIGAQLNSPNRKKMRESWLKSFKTFGISYGGGGAMHSQPSSDTFTRRF